MKGESTIYIVSAVIIIAVIGGIIWWGSVGQNSGQNASDQTATSTDAVTNVSAATSTAASSTSSTIQNFMHDITLKTSKGNIVFETYDADAPNTVANFIKLADSGFYNGTLFHRVIQGFMIQGGDPLTKDPSKEALWGTGNPGYTFADELNPNTPSYQAGYVRGTVAMANSGPNTNGSQFFIVQQNQPDLPHNYTIFGKVISGMDVVDAIASVPTNGNPPQGENRPLTPVTLESVTVSTTTSS